MLKRLWLAADAECARCGWRRSHSSNPGRGLEPQELLDEAIARILETRRNWPDDVEVIPFIRKVMQSIATDHADRAWYLRESVGSQDDAVGDSAPFPAGDPSPEDQVADVAVAQQVADMMSDDEDAVEWLTGVSLGMRRAQIAEECGWDDASRADNARERVRRRLRADGVPWLRPEQEKSG